VETEIPVYGAPPFVRVSMTGRAMVALLQPRADTAPTALGRAAPAAAWMT